MKTTTKPTTFEYLNFEIKRLNAAIKPTIDDSRQFETNCRNNFKVNILSSNLSILQKWNDNIGKTVFKLVNNIAYSEIQNPDLLNKTEDEPILFTEELFNEFKHNVINWWIEYHTKELIIGSITRNSSHKLSNLEFEWQLECKQELIKMYNELIGKYYF